jgi:hypothetical protein
MRILFTASRHLTVAKHKRLVADAISSALDAPYLPAELLVPDERLGQRLLWDRITFVNGGGRGGDQIGAGIARAWGMTVETHTAKWELHGRRAGPVRNEAMVKLGADVCVALPQGQSPGTRHCAALADRAGIPVLMHEVPT